MAKRTPEIPTLYRSLLSQGEQAYREAVAQQIENRDPTTAWEKWQGITAALLLASWASGAGQTLKAAGVSIPKAAAVERFDRDVPPMLLRFEPGPAREVIRRFMDAIPLTRQKWDALIDHAFAAADEMRRDEAATALIKMADRSPDLASVIFPAATGAKPKPVPGQVVKSLPTAVKVRRTPGVQAVTQGTFFVTGMTQEQIEATRDLLAKTVRGEETLSVAGKKLKRLGVGDFVEQTILATGTDLTKARLETVYRTNLNRAATQGQLDIVRDETVKAFVPLMQFSSTKDNRTRPTHKAMNGYVATVEQIDAQGIPTPGGFNCRCAWKPVSLGTAVSRGWCDEDGNPNYAAIKTHNGSRQRLIDSGQYPDPGFISG